MRNFLKWWSLGFLGVLVAWWWWKSPETKIFEPIKTTTPTPTIEEDKVKVAIMADIHNDSEELTYLLGQTKERQTEMVVLAGDLSNDGSEEEMLTIKKTADESGLVWVAIPGNHERSLKIFKSIFGADYRSLRVGEIKLILINNAYYGGLGEEQKRWLEAEVKECQERVCLAVMHKPLNNLFSKHVMGENSEKVTAEATWLRELLINAGVKMIAAGHLHYASSYVLEGIRTDIVGAVSGVRNNQGPRYTELMIGRNNIERRVVEGRDDFGN